MESTSVAFQEKVERRGEGEEVVALVVVFGIWLCVWVLGAVNVIIVLGLMDDGLGRVSEFAFLRENAESFFRNAEYLYGQGEYNLAAFNVEQAMQLMLKYFLAVKVGDFPRTRSLRRLFREARSLCPRLWEFYEKYASVVGNIESAYIASRYYPTRFERVEVEEMLEVYAEFVGVLEECL